MKKKKVVLVIVATIAVIFLAYESVMCTLCIRPVLHAKEKEWLM